MTASQQLLQRRDAVVPRGVPRVTTATVARASGATLEDLDGRLLIDFAGGIGVVNVGHCDPEVVAAIHDQAGRLIHTCIHVATYEPYVALCERLAGLFPHGDVTKVLLVNSGAEAVENAVKIARQATDRPALLCFTGAFHGRTLLGMTLSSKVGYKIGCGPFAPEVYRLPYPNRYLDGDQLGEDAFVERELARLDHAFHTLVAPEDLAAVLVEPVQGEGGFLPAPSRWIAGLRERADRHGFLLIFDEVQSGFCRTGKWAAYQHFAVRPDLSTWAKSLGAGLPIAAVIGRGDVMDAARPGTIGGTYGGNPVACAAALAAIDVMARRDLNARATAIGDRIRARFTALQQRCAAIGEVRGIGAMIGIELVHDGDPHRPAGAEVKEIVARCVERGVLVIPAGYHGNVLRILSPLVIGDDLLEQGLDVMEEEILRTWPADAGANASATGAR